MNNAECQVRDQAFCYFGLLRDPDRLKRLVKLLPDWRQVNVCSLMDELADVSEQELQNRMKLLRKTELRKGLEKARRQFGSRFDLLPPRLQRWFEAKIERR